MGIQLNTFATYWARPCLGLLIFIPISFPATTAPRSLLVLTVKVKEKLHDAAAGRHARSFGSGGMPQGSLPVGRGRSGRQRKASPRRRSAGEGEMMERDWEGGR